MAKKNKKTKFNAFVGKNEIVLSEGLIKKIYKEVLPQIDSNFENADFEITIEVIHEIEEVQEPLSTFNKALKKALDFNPKAKK